MAVQIGSGTVVQRASTRFYSARCLFAYDGDIYVVTGMAASTQVRVYKSTDQGATFSEMDSANRPATFAANYDYDAWIDEGVIYISYYSGANSISVGRFDCATELYLAGLGVASAAATGNMRIVVRPDGDVLVFHNPSADTTIIAVDRYESGSWTSDETVADFTNAVGLSEVAMDRNGNATIFVREGTAADFSYFSYSNSNAASVVTDLDTSVSAGITFGNSTMYDAAGVDTIIALYLDSDGTTNGYVVTLDGEAPHTTGSELTIGSTGATSGASAFKGGNTFYAVWYAAAATQINYATSADGITWNAEAMFADGANPMGMAAPILGGVAVVYDAGGATRFDWIVQPPEESSGKNLPIPLARGRR